MYLDNVNIPTFEHIPGHSYSGIHCEFGVYAVRTSKELADYMMMQTNSIIQNSETRQMF